MKKLFLVALCAFGLFSLRVPEVQASLVFAEAAQEQVHKGDLVTLDWFVNTDRSTINTLDVTIAFSGNVLTLVEASIADSLVSAWVQKPTETEPGLLHLTGGFAGGVRGERVPLFKTIFKAAAQGQANIALGPNSRILLNDGRGTQDTVAFKPISFRVLEPNPEQVSIFSITHPNELQWYASNKVTIRLDGMENQVLSYSFSKNVEESPAEQPMRVSSPLTFSPVEDGVYYFKLSKQTANNTWVGVGMFKVQIDQTPPEPFTALGASEPGMFGGKPFLSFATVDKASGVEGYFRKGILGRLKPIQSPYVYSRPWLHGNITLIAKDKAGNIRESRVYVHPKVGPEHAVGVLLGLVAVVLYTYWKFHRKKKQK